MYRLPQEIEVWYIIPKIRKELAKELVESHKWSYEKTGDSLGITKAAVSQYLKDKRGNKIKISKDIEKEIKLSAKRIFEKRSNSLIEIQNILRRMKETKCACNVCKKYNKEILNYCKCKPTY